MLHKERSLNESIPILRLFYGQNWNTFVDYSYIAAAIISVIAWPRGLSTIGGILLLINWLIILLFLFSIAEYSQRDLIMPNTLVYPMGIAASIYMVFNSVISRNGFVIVSGILGALILAGFFYITFLVSKGRWVGYANVRVGFFAGLLLGWRLSLLCLGLDILLLVLVFLSLKFSNKRHVDKVSMGPIWLTAITLCILWGQRVISG